MSISKWVTELRKWSHTDRKVFAQTSNFIDEQIVESDSKVTLAFMIGQQNFTIIIANDTVKYFE